MKPKQQNKQAPKQPAESSANNINPRTDSMSQLKSIASTLAVNISIITATVTMAGFFTIQSYLATFSAFSYNFSITQYISAGISILVDFLLRISPDALQGALIAIIGLSIGGILWYLANKYKNSTRLEPAIDRILRIMSSLEKLNQRVAVIGLSLLFLAFSFSHGSIYYAQVPRYLGGGMPVNIILVFDEVQSPQDSIWGFQINPTNPRQSKQVQLIMELTDGVIVRYGSSGNVDVVMVKNDVINAIIYQNNASTSTP